MADEKENADVKENVFDKTRREMREKQERENERRDEFEQQLERSRKQNGF